VLILRHVCVCVLQSAGNEHRLLVIHRLSQKKARMHTDVCTSIQHSSHPFVLKATQNPLCKDTTGTHRSVLQQPLDTVT